MLSGWGLVLHKASDLPALFALLYINTGNGSGLEIKGIDQAVEICCRSPAISCKTSVKTLGRPK